MHQNENSRQNEKSAKVFNNQWILKKKVSSGSFGVVFIGQDKVTKELVAIKLEKEDNEEIRSLDREVQILQKLQGLQQVPKLYWSGQESNYNIMVITLLGRDLAHFIKVHKKLSIKTVLMLMDQLIPVLENIHNRSVIHRDLKPENILMGREKESHLVYMLDFGISKIFRDSQGRHIPFREKKPFIGTTRYASVAAHLGHELGRKDDLESLGYVMIFLAKGQLPWQNLQNVADKDKTEVVGELKLKTKSSDLCKDLPIEFAKYLDYVKKLPFKATPDYKYLKNLFLKLGQSLNVKYATNDFDWRSNNSSSSNNNNHNNSMPFIENQHNIRSSILSSQQQNPNSMNIKTGNSLLVPNDMVGGGVGGKRQNKRTTSLTPSQRSSSSRRSTFMSGVSQNSVYIKYQPQGSMYKPNSYMNFDEVNQQNQKQQQQVVGNNNSNINYQLLQQQQQKLKNSQMQNNHNYAMSKKRSSEGNLDDQRKNRRQSQLIQQQQHQQRQQQQQQQQNYNNNNQQQQDKKNEDQQVLYTSSSMYCNIEMDEWNSNTLENKLKMLQNTSIHNNAKFKSKRQQNSAQNL